MTWVELLDDENRFTFDKDKVTVISKVDIGTTCIYFTDGRHLTVDYTYETVKRLLGINTNE